MENTIIEYLIQLSSEEGHPMIRLAGLTYILEFLKQGNIIKQTFLQKGLIDTLVNFLDYGSIEKKDITFLNLSLKCIFQLSKLPVSPVQPLITDNIVSRLLRIMDVKRNLFSFSKSMLKLCKEKCEDKHLVCKVQSVKMNEEKWFRVHKLSQSILTSHKHLPSTVQFCTLYETVDGQDISLTQLLVEKSLAWPLEDHKKSKESEVIEQGESWEDIIVTKMVGGGVFWAWVGIDAIQTCHDLERTLKSQYQDGALRPHVSQKGDYVVVCKITDADLSFIRAQVIHTDHINIRVLSMDHGYEMTINHKQVYSMPQELESIPSQLSLCCMKGVQEPPLCQDALQTAIAVLCNLCSKSFPAGEMVERLGGLDIIENLLLNSPDHNIDIQILRLINNLSCNSWLKNSLSESNLMQIVLEKIKKYIQLEESKIKSSLLHNSLMCMSSLLYKNREQRSAFYNLDGVNTVLTCALLSKQTSDTYKLCMKCLKNFLEKIGDPSLASAVDKETFGNTQKQKKQRSPSKQKSDLPSEFSKFTMSKSDSQKKQEMQPVTKALPLQHLQCDNDSEEETPQHSQMDRSSHSKEGNFIMDRMSLAGQSEILPSQLAADMKKYHILGSRVDFEADSIHELRPNKSVKTVSSVIIAEIVCGMLNSGKVGTIFFGILPEGFVQGVSMSRDEKDEFRLGVDRLMMGKLTPGILHSMYNVEYVPVYTENSETKTLVQARDLYVAEIQIKAVKGTTYTMAGSDQCFIRFGSVTTLLSIQEMRYLIIALEESEYQTEILRLQLELAQIMQS